MNLGDVHRGSHRPKRRRRGRGIGSGHGKTSGRGHKGQRSRAGWSRPPTFQGGTMPLVRRIPKRGFHNRWAKVITIVNLSDLEQRFQTGDEVTPESLRLKNLAKGPYDEIKILAGGQLSKRLKVSAHRFSRTARQKIESVGGEAVVLAGPAVAAKTAGA
ncbi:MAG: 50S ribosomal protein L15 [Planctomycetes bacterium RBG_16_64_10]|nr:MAG: 50S ribosomal protein L15 [Planctomycetes bacterium RBG_16_64_10]